MSITLYRTARTLDRAMKPGGHWTPSRDYARRTHLDLPVWRATLPASANVHRLVGRVDANAIRDFEGYDAVAGKASGWSAIEYAVLKPEVLLDVRIDT